MKNPQEIFKNETIKITYKDKSRRYFGDFHEVVLEITSEMTILPTHFEEESIYEEIKNILGQTLTTTSTLRQMGVASAQLESVKNSLIGSFRSNSLPYFLAPGFVCKATVSQTKDSRKKNRLPITLSGQCSS